MVAAKTLIKTYVTNADSVANVVNKVNNELARNNERSMFATLFIGVLNLKSGDFNYLNCGHCPPILLSENQSPQILTTKSGPPVGIIEDHIFTEQRISLEKNQTLVVYSDGVTEAMNSKGELFSEGQLVNLLAEDTPKLSPEVIINKVFKSVKDFEGETPQSDDIALFTIKYLS
jgi:sigma-B regulation protein RsbU (phosphoserine phosphatase)